MKWLRRTRDLLIIVCLSFALIHAIDAMYGYLYPPGVFEIGRRVGLVAYRDEPYDVRAMLLEQLKANGVELRGRNLALPKPFEGKHFNVDHMGESTYRRTANVVSREAASSQVLVLGGSTVLCGEVDDARTFPSLLADALSRRSDEYGSNYVLNAGMQAADSNRDLERLEWELDHGLRPDVVVLLAGVNEVYQGVYQNRPEGPVPMGALLERMAKRRSAHAKGAKDVPSTWISLPRLITTFLPTRIYTSVRLERALAEPARTPRHMQAPANRSQFAQRTRTNFERNVRAMQRLSEAHGFDLYVFLQPHVFGTKAPADRPDVAHALVEAERRTPMLRQAFIETYPLLKEAVEVLRGEGIRALDVSNAFDETGALIFVDFCHVNSAGNRALAGAIAPRLQSVRTVN